MSLVAIGFFSLKSKLVDAFWEIRSICEMAMMPDYETSKVILDSSVIPHPSLVVAHAGGGIDGLSYTNSQEALDSALLKGVHYFELDFEWTSDHELVCMHDWDSDFYTKFGLTSGPISLAEYKRLKMRVGLHQLELNDVVKWVHKHQKDQVFIITDIKHENLTGLRLIAQLYPEMTKYFIPQIYYFLEYPQVREMGFDHVILTLYRSHYTDRSVSKFAEKYPLYALTMPVARGLAELPHHMKEKGIFTYAHTVNDLQMLQALQENGVNGIYTDFLLDK